MFRSLVSRSSFALTVALLFTVGASARVTEKFSKVFPLAGDGTVALSNVNGEVEIVGWDRNEVSVEAEKSAADAEALQRFSIETDSTPDRLVIKTVHEKRWKIWGNSNPKVSYKLRVPAGATLKKIDVVNASIHVSGVRGFVDLDSVNGTIKAEGLTAGGRFDTVNGSITASFTAVQPDAKILLDTVNGTCTVVFPKEAAFSLKADSVNGRVTCDFPIKLSQSSRGTLSGTVNGGGTQVVLDSVNGRLRVLAAE